MRELGVYVREFPDGSGFEIGVLEDWGRWLVMDVGNFAYVMNWNTFEHSFTWIGLV